VFDYDNAFASNSAGKDNGSRTGSQNQISGSPN
jgi:hypothetical protein